MAHMADSLFAIALNNFLARYNAYLDAQASEFVFPFGVDEDGVVTWNVPIERLRTIPDINHLDSLFQEMGFLSK